jgi:hypothetical protein
MTVKMTFPGRVSLIHSAHDRIEGGHDRHRVGDQVALHEQSDGLEVEVRRVVDAHPERLVGAVADDVRRVLAARAFDRAVGAARARPQQPRQLGDDRPVRHLVEALVDDPQALLDLVDAQQVAGEAVAPDARRDVEVELRVDRVGVRPADVEGHAGGTQVRSGKAHAQRGLGINCAEAAHPPDEDLVLVEQALVRLELLGGPAHPVPEAAHEVVVEVAVDATDPEVVEQHPLPGQRRQHLDDLVALDE